MPTVIGLDPGFGYLKAATPNRVVALPSVVGVGSTDLGLLTLGLPGGRRAPRQASPDAISFDGVSYLVGERVADYARPIERMDFGRLSDGPELRALVYATLATLLTPGEHAAAIMVGLPVEVMLRRELAQETLRGLRAWLVGRHAYTANGQPVSLEVTEVKAMAQPAGAFFAWGLDEWGQWARPASDAEAPVAVCDIGFNTCDLFTVARGQVQGRFTGGESLGMRRAAETLMETVRRQVGVALSLHQADAALRDPTDLPTASGPLDVAPLVAQALDAMIGGTLALVERHWGTGTQFAHLLFAGGGPAHPRVAAALLRAYPHGVILPHTATANATGLARYGLKVLK